MMKSPKKRVKRFGLTFPHNSRFPGELDGAFRPSGFLRRVFAHGI